MTRYCLCSNVNLFLSLKVFLSSIPVFKQHINKLDFNVEEYDIYSDKKARDTLKHFLNGSQITHSIESTCTVSDCWKRKYAI